MDVSVKTARAIYDPAYKCCGIISFEIFAKFGPIKADPIPANNIIEIAFGAISLSTVSTAANRYWWLKATPAPIKKHPKLNNIKLSIIIEQAAIKDAKEHPIEAKINPNLLPIILIIFAANIAKIAIPTIESAIGKVAKNFMGLNWEPIIPLKKTVTGAAVNAKIWLKINNQRFLFIKTYTYL